MRESERRYAVLVADLLNMAGRLDALAMRAASATATSAAKESREIAHALSDLGGLVEAEKEIAALLGTRETPA